MVSKSILLVIGVALAIAGAFLLFSIQYSPLWLFSKYKRLRPLIVAQAKFETGNFTSSLYWRAFNCFGMKVPTKRKSLRTGETNDYSSYLLPVLSLGDLFLYFDHFGWTESTIDSIIIENGGFASRSNQLLNYCRLLKFQSYFESSIEQYYKGCLTYLQ